MRRCACATTGKPEGLSEFDGFSGLAASQASKQGFSTVRHVDDMNDEAVCVLHVLLCSCSDMCAIHSRDAMIVGLGQTEN
jgi:hypothetical protein